MFACSDHDLFIKFNRRGFNKQREGRKIVLKLIDEGPIC